MKRTFQGRIHIGAIIIFFLLFFITFYFLMEKNMLAIPLMVFVILWLERMLHTEFIIQGGELCIHKGRFCRDKIVLLKNISRIEQGISIYTKLGIFSYLNILLNDGRTVSVWPSDEMAFVECIKKLKNKNKELETE